MSARPAVEGRGKPRGIKGGTDPAVRARAEELTAQGIPVQMAMAVAHGRVTLNEALEKLARREQVNKMMERHDLSRALATQIALGQASLETVLASRRLQEHIDAYRNRSVLDELAASGEPVTLLLHGHRRVTGKVLAVESYQVRFQPEEGDAVDIHKLQVKLAFSPDAYKRVRKVIKFDKALEANPKPPIERPQDRYTCSDKRMFHYLDAKIDVVATSLEGEQLRGHVAWFGRYEFGLHLKGEADVTVFRHALADLREV